MSQIIYTACFDGYKHLFNWHSKEMFVNSWILSTEYAKREFPEYSIQINCYDDLALEFFQALALPEINIVSKTLDWNYSPLWVLTKLCSYKDAPTEFIHLDHDVFLHEGFREVFNYCLSDSDFLFQQPEGLNVYFHGKIASETGDSIPYWNTNLHSYPNVGFLYSRKNTWSEALFKHASSFVKRNIYYCRDFPNMCLALALEQQPIGVIASRTQSSILLANEEEWNTIMLPQIGPKKITHFMGHSKLSVESDTWVKELTDSIGYPEVLKQRALIVLDKLGK